MSQIADRLPEVLTPADFDGLIASARHDSWDAEDVAQLALRLSASGIQLTWSSEGESIADVASTGGPGSLSTLIAPLALRVFRNRVVKLAVPGRPAGAIDVLATVPGYRSSLSPGDIRRVVDECGFAHFLSSGQFTPLDAALFAYRKEHNAVDLPVLASASILAKKVAVGVQNVGLDSRVGPHGNFGATVDDARANASRFCAAARRLGLNAVVFLTTATVAQPLIGRGEALVGLADAVGVHTVPDEIGWLGGHISDCVLMAQTVANATAASWSADQLRSAFAEHLKAQGSDMESFVRRVTNVVSAPHHSIVSRSHGTLAIDVAAVRSVLTKAQSQSTQDFADPLGLTLQAKPGAYVAEGDILAKVRYELVDAAQVEEVLDQLQAAFATSNAQHDDAVSADRLEAVRE